MAYKLTGNGAKDIVAIARTQLGYHESNKASDLGGTSSGTKNYTEYGRWFMDGKTSCTKGPWCAKFVSWCAYMAGIGADKIRMSKAAAAGDFKGSNTDVYSWKDVKDGRVVPQEGDLIIFRSSSAEKLSASSSTLLNHGTHVELACSYQTNPKNKNQGLLTTIGGNTSDRVKEHSNMTVSKKTGYCSVMGMYVYAIVRPRYCSHVWDAAGVCTKAGCSAQYDWKATGKTSAAGIYGVTTATSAWTNPFTASPSIAKVSLDKGERLTVTRSVTNAQGKLWYELAGGTRAGCYVPQEAVSFLWSEKTIDTAVYATNSWHVAVWAEPSFYSLCVSNAYGEELQTGTPFTVSASVVSADGMKWLKLASTEGKYAGRYVLQEHMQFLRIDSGFRLEDDVLPNGTLETKQEFKLAGKVSSNYQLKSVRAEILTYPDEAVVQKAQAGCTGKQADLSALLASRLDFAKLQPDEYLLRLYVSDEKNTDTELVEQRFNVELASYLLSFETNDPCYGMPADITFTDGSTVQLPTDEPSAPFMTFLGWGSAKKAAENDGFLSVDYKPGDSYSGESDTLYAMWGLNGFEVYYFNDETDSFGLGRFYWCGEDAIVDSPENTTRTDATFAGWALSKNSRVVRYRVGDVIPALGNGESYDLYPVWRYNDEYRYAISTGEEDGYAASVDDATLGTGTDGTAAGDVIIFDYKNSDEDLFIPETLDGKPVTALHFYKTEYYNGYYSQWPSFRNSDSVVTLHIPASTQSIQIYGSNQSDSNISGVGGLKNLQSIQVDEANPNYRSLDGVLLSRDKTTLMAYPPAKAGSSYAVPDGVQSLGKFSFANTSALEHVTLPDGLTSIAGRTFFYSSVKTVEIPASVETLGYAAFYECASLQSVTFLGAPPANCGEKPFWWSSREGGMPEGFKVLYPKSRTADWDADGDGLWNGVPAEAFDDSSLPGVRDLYYNSFVRDVTLPETQHLNGLSGVNLSREEPSSEGRVFLGWYVRELDRYYEAGSYLSLDGIAGSLNAWAVWAEDTGLRYQLNTEEQTLTVESYVGSDTTLTIQDTLDLPIETIGDGAFVGCQTLVSVTLPASVKNIGSFAFFGCSNLELVNYLGTSELKVGDNAFTGCADNLRVGVQTNSLTKPVMQAGAVFASAAKIDYALQITSADTVASGEVLALTAVCPDPSFTADSVSWQLDESDSAYAKILNGQLLAYTTETARTVTLSASSPNSNGVVARQTITIQPKPQSIHLFMELDDVTDQPQTIDLLQSDLEFDCEVQVLPLGAPQNVTVSVSDPSVLSAEFDAEKGCIHVQILSAGSAEITVTADKVVTTLAFSVGAELADDFELTLDEVQQNEQTITLTGSLPADEAAQPVRLYAAVYDAEGQMLLVRAVEAVPDAEKEWSISLPRPTGAAELKLYAVSQQTGAPFGNALTVRLT